MNKALLHISEENLDELLDLPEGMRVTDYHRDHTRRSYTFVVSSQSLPYTAEGECYPEIQAIYKKKNGIHWAGYRVVRYGQALA